MKIAVLKESLAIGGTERAAANISSALAKDHEVSLVLYDADDIQYRYGGELVDLHCPAKKTVVGKIAVNFLRYFRLRQFLKKNAPDVLFELISVENPISYVAHKKQIQIMSARNYSALQAFPHLYHKSLAVSDAMICNSGQLKDDYVSKYPEDADKVFCVYNIIDADQITADARQETEEAFERFLQSHHFNLIGVGRFCREKGFENLIRVVSYLKRTGCDVGLTLVGDGELKAEYEALIAELALADDVFFTGFQNNPYKYMARCDCFVLSSYNEGFPNVLAEAMTLSLPVVSTNCVSGPAELLRKDGDYDAVKTQFAACDYGILTPVFKDNDDNSRAIEEMANAIRMLLTDSDQRSAFSSAARQRALEFSVDAAAAELVRVFQTLMERKNG